MATDFSAGRAATDPATLQILIDGPAIYTYAIARIRPAAEASAMPIPGIDRRHPVRELASGGLVALVSDVSMADYDLEQLRIRFQDSLWVEMLAREHQRVMLALLERYTLLPLKLCTLYHDEARISEQLAERVDAFGAALDRVAGTREWGVKVFSDRAALSAWAANELPQLRELAAQLKAASPGARYMLEKRMARAVEQTANDLRHRGIEAIGHALAAVARAALAVPLQPTQIHGRPDDMLLNGAYLVVEGEEAQFRATLEALSEEYGQRGFTFVLTGPWPPYSFSTPADEEVA